MTRIKFIMFGQLQQMVLHETVTNLQLTNLLLCKAPSQNFPAERRQKHSTNKVIPKQAQNKPIFDK